MMDQHPPLILASASPRRRELLEGLNVNFSVRPASIDEREDEGLAPAELVRRLAERKAEAVAAHEDSGLVIGADTVVALEGSVLGKPDHETDAFQMLQRLQDREHIVYSGLCVINAATREKRSGARPTSVKMKPLSEEDIRLYIQTGEPMDKAGAYGIQGVGSVFVERMDGDYFNVMGMSLYLLDDYLRFFGYTLLENRREGQK